jgi:hypothetical protein
MRRKGWQEVAESKTFDFRHAGLGRDAGHAQCAEVGSFTIDVRCAPGTQQLCNRTTCPRNTCKWRDLKVCVEICSSDRVWA